VEILSLVSIHFGGACEVRWLGTLDESFPGQELCLTKPRSAARMREPKSSGVERQDLS